MNDNDRRSNGTYLLGIITVHSLFEISCGITHDNYSILHNIRQIYVVVAGDHAATSAAYFLSQITLHTCG